MCFLFEFGNEPDSFLGDIKKIAFSGGHKSRKWFREDNRLIGCLSDITIFPCLYNIITIIRQFPVSVQKSKYAIMNDIEFGNENMC